MDLFKVNLVIKLKYLIFIITILFFTIVSYSYAQEQNKTNPTHKESIEKLATVFFRIFCHETLPKTIKSVRNCYVISPENNSSIEYCLIVDKYLIDVANYNKQSNNIYPVNTINFINGYKFRLITSFIINGRFINYSLSSYNEAINDNVLEFSKNITILYHQYDQKQEKCSKNDFFQFNLLNN